MSEKRFDIIVQDKVAKTIRTELQGIGAAAGGTRQMISAMKAEMASLSAGAGGLNSTASAATRAMRDQASAAAALTRALRDQAQAARDLAQANAAAAGRPGAPGAPGTPGGAGGAGGAGAGRGGARGAGSAGTAGAARGIREVGEAAKLSAQYSAQLGFQLNDVFVSLASGQKPMTVFIQQGAQIAQLPAQAGMSWKQFGTAALNTLGIVKRTGDAALDAAAAQAATAAAAVAAANAQASANVRVAETEVALATAQTEAAVTANEQAAASLRLTAANEALAAANAEAAVTANALSAAQGKSAQASTAASAASTRSLSGLARGGVYAAIILGAFALTMAGVKAKAEEGSTGLKKYTKEMGYTASEVKKLNAVSVSWGDTAKAIFQVGMKRIADAFGINVSDMKKAWSTFLSYLASGTRATIAGMYAAFAGFYEFGHRIGEMAKKGDFTTLDFSTFTGSFKKAYGDAQKFMDDAAKQAQANARERQDKMAKDMFDAPHQKKGPKPWDRAKELRNENAALDEQIKMLSLYGDELERANQLEEIAKKFRDHNVPLTQAETAALEAKIKTLQDGRRVQQAMTAADEAANGPARTYDATITALTAMLDKGKIAQDEFNRQMNLAKRAYEDATDPLAEMNRELERTGELMGQYGRSRDVAEYIQQLEKAAQAQGRTIYQPGGPTQTDADGNIVVSGRSKVLTPQAQGMVDEFRKQQEQERMTRAFEAIDPREREDPTSSSYILDHHKEMYAEIERLRQKDTNSEEEAARRKQNVDKAYLDARLSNASTVLGNLASLQSSNNKKVAAIGKAAAIAQATIDGIRAVQAALAGPPGPPWSFAIAATTAVATAANVAKIAGIGFMRGGYTGNGATTEAAGTVHGQEYVFDAAATRRIGVPALEALRNGGTLGIPSNDNGAGGGNVNVGSINVNIQGTPDDPVATGREVQLGIRRGLRDVARKEIASEMRDGGLLSGGAMAR